MRALSNRSKTRGSVLLIVLWTAALLTILVTAMASKVRLSARTAFNTQLAADDQTQLTSALHSAEMEILLELMSTPVDAVVETNAEGEPLNRLHRFDGRPLRLSYPTPDSVVVRIYNHAGKINLNRIPRANMQLLIEKRLEETTGDEPDDEEVQELLAAWTDWTDLNDLEGIEGAERDYYESLSPGYIPRNNPELDTVDELLHIRGFRTLFADINLDAAFTIYGNNRQVNLNLATRETLELLPGLTPELITKLEFARQVDAFSNRSEIGEVVPFENLSELSPWLSNETSNFYTIFVYPRPAEAGAKDAPARSAASFDPQAYPLEMPRMHDTRVGDEALDTGDFDEQMMAKRSALASAKDPWELAPGIPRQGFSEIVEVIGADSPPRVYQVNPIKALPRY